MYVHAQLALALGKDGEVEFAEQLAKMGLSAALGVYGEKDDPAYKPLAERFGWLREMSNAGDNPIGDAFSAFGV